MNVKSLFYFLITGLIGCNAQQPKNLNKPVPFVEKKVALSDKEKQTWYLMDYGQDTVPGTSLQRAHERLKGKHNEEIIIAVIDTDISPKHPSITKNFWKNQNEIANNNIDDDGNGYVDDVHGWNFIGNKNGDRLIYEYFEFTRIVKYYENSKNKRELDFTEEDYSKAKKTLKDKAKQREEYFISDSTYTEDLKRAVAVFENIVPRPKLTLKKLDSIAKRTDSLSKEIETLKWAVKHDYSIDDAIADLKIHNRYRKYYYNFNYDERAITKDDPSNIRDTDYGNNIVSYDQDFIDHATPVAGTILKFVSSPKISKTATAKFKIMPIVAACYGQAHDKDLALAIRYAVDNGARIINMSIIKEFSTNKNWLLEAIAYAAEKDVLIVNGAGNANTNIDDNKNYFPNDSDYIHNEVAQNFIMVGGSTYQAELGFKYYNSNYGKENVDILAPAVDIYAPSGHSGFSFASGTSMSAPIVSGIAALLRSYYPFLSATQVKKIIMSSGNRYNTMPTLSKKKKETAPFSSLSKSGAIVNAHNAILLADQFRASDKNRSAIPEH